MAILKDILFGINLKSIQGNREIEISSIAADSRKVENGSLFIAVKGLSVDGHQFISKAIEKGAVAILCEEFPQEIMKNVAYIQTNDTSNALGIVASNYYGRPSEKLQLVGITGTNGKTSCATMLFQLFLAKGYATGLISTVENKINNEIIPSTHTTPDAISLQKLLARMVEVGCTHCFMEVSSHALVQKRTAGTTFCGAVFTNISHDHLDYHHTFDEYIKAKKLLFDGLSSEAFALVNADDKRGEVMLQNTKASMNKFAIKSMAGFTARVIQDSFQGMELTIDGINVWFNLIGLFNAYNLLTVYSTAILLGEEKEDILSLLSLTKGARGRFQNIPNTMNISAIVDYAHTPDALENVLKTINNIRTNNETLVTVVGCGGDRDKTKRPEMARIAAQMSNKVILTSDNPRTESPKDILEDMRKGIPKSLERNVMVIEDRKEAIRTACNLVQQDDILLVAGKGHETYQEIDGVRHHFDDKEILMELLNT